jgi:hypothetical protein
MSSIFGSGTRRVHPDEDFAETFAVWLRPRSKWRTRYAGWPALKKLEYVDELMHEIAGKRPLVSTRERVDPLHELSETIGEHYQKSRRSTHSRHRRLTTATSPGCFPPIRDIAESRRLLSSSGSTALKSGSWLRDGRARTSLRSMPCWTT